MPVAGCFCDSRRGKWGKIRHSNGNRSGVGALNPFDHGWMEKWGKRDVRSKVTWQFFH
jgi:hypothetical protein